jgi:hypothetical protein
MLPTYAAPCPLILSSLTNNYTVVTVVWLSTEGV